MINIFEQIIRPVVAASGDFVGNVALPTSIPSQTTSIAPFISSIVRFIVVIAGLFTLWQFLMGGFGMITGGSDKGKIAEAQNKITMAITGLVIIAASFLIIGVISKLLFGSYYYIISPQLQSVTP